LHKVVEANAGRHHLAEKRVEGMIPCRLVMGMELDKLEDEVAS